MNREDFFEELARDYPYLMEKAFPGFGIFVEKGWFGIIRMMFESIYSDCLTAENQLRAAKEYPRDTTGEYEEECRKRLKEIADKLPSFQEIKEKYGTMRVYAYNTTEVDSALISFAERMSSVTCEKCGKPGKATNTSWIKTYCREHSGDEDIDYPHSSGKTNASFID